MPVTKKTAEECCAKCESDVAELKREIAALRAELKKAPKGRGGSDARVDKILEALKRLNGEKFWKDAGL